MEKLVKGLLEVALGGGDDDQPRRQDNVNRRDDLSRSTWSEVVSENKDDPPARYQGDRFTSENEEFRRKPECYEAADSKPSRFPRNQEGEDSWKSANRKEHRQTYEEKEDDWNTSGTKDNRKTFEEGDDSWNKGGRNEQRQNYEGGEDRWNKGGRKEQRQNYEDGKEQPNQWETVGRKQHKVQKDQWSDYKRQPSKQQYGEEYRGSESLEPSQQELNSLSQACNRLWDLDSNRLVPREDYEIDCGEGKKVSQREDMAEANLFKWVKEDVLRRPTFSRFCSLLDNYNPYQGTKEVVSDEERQEQAAFIEEISRTAPIKYLHNYLVAKHIMSENYQNFKSSLTSLWFDLYGRGGTSKCSSAFEHVFVGEIKDSHEQEEVSGFHNWLQFYLQECKGKVDYRGYIFPRRRGEMVDSDAQLMTVQFQWNGVLKSVSSTLIGVSPEMEIALYTLCYYAGEEDNFVDLGPYSVNIKCYRLGDRIGSVFPIANS